MACLCRSPEKKIKSETLKGWIDQLHEVNDSLRFNVEKTMECVASVSSRQDHLSKALEDAENRKCTRNEWELLLTAMEDEKNSIDQLKGAVNVVIKENRRLVSDLDFSKDDMRDRREEGSHFMVIIEKLVSTINEKDERIHAFLRQDSDQRHPTPHQAVTEALYQAVYEKEHQVNTMRTLTKIAERDCRSELTKMRKLLDVEHRSTDDLRTAISGYHTEMSEIRKLISRQEERDKSAAELKQLLQKKEMELGEYQVQYENLQDDYVMEKTTSRIEIGNLREENEQLQVLFQNLQSAVSKRGAQVKSVFATQQNENDRLEQVKHTDGNVQCSMASENKQHSDSNSNQNSSEGATHEPHARGKTRRHTEHSELAVLRDRNFDEFKQAMYREKMNLDLRCKNMTNTHVHNTISSTAVQQRNLEDDAKEKINKQRTEATINCHELTKNMANTIPDRLAYLEKNCNMAMLILEDREKEISDLRKCLFERTLDDNSMPQDVVSMICNPNQLATNNNCICSAGTKDGMCCYRKAVAALADRDKEIENLRAERRRAVEVSDLEELYREYKSKIEVRNTEISNVELLYKDVKTQLAQQCVQTASLLEQLNEKQESINRQAIELESGRKKYDEAAVQIRRLTKENRLFISIEQDLHKCQNDAEEQRGLNERLMQDVQRKVREIEVYESKLQEHKADLHISVDENICLKMKLETADNKLEQLQQDYEELRTDRKVIKDELNALKLDAYKRDLTAESHESDSVRALQIKKNQLELEKEKLDEHVEALTSANEKLKQMLNDQTIENRTAVLRVDDHIPRIASDITQYEAEQQRDVLTSLESKQESEVRKSKLLLSVSPNKSETGAPNTKMNDRGAETSVSHDGLASLQKQVRSLLLENTQLKEKCSNDKRSPACENVKSSQLNNADGQRGCLNDGVIAELKTMCIKQGSVITTMQEELNDKSCSLQYCSDHNDELRRRLAELQVEILCFRAARVMSEEGRNDVEDKSPDKTKNPQATKDAKDRLIDILRDQIKEANTEFGKVEEHNRFLRSRLAQAQHDFGTSEKSKLELEKRMFEADPGTLDAVFSLRREIHQIRQEKSEEMGEIKNQLHNQEIAVGNLSAQNKELRCELGESQKEVYRLKKEMGDMEQLHQAMNEEDPGKSCFRGKKRRGSGTLSEKDSLVETLEGQIRILERELKERQIQNMELRWVLEEREKELLEDGRKGFTNTLVSSTEDETSLSTEDDSVSQSTATTTTFGREQQRLISSLEKKIKDSKHEYKQVLVENEDMKSQVRDLQNQLVRLKSDKSDLNDKEKNADNRKKRQQDMHDETENVIEGLHVEIKNKNIEILKLNQQCQDLRKTLGEVQKQDMNQAVATSNADELKNEIERVHEERDSLCKEKDDFIIAKQIVINQKDKIIESLTAQIHELQRQSHSRAGLAGHLEESDFLDNDLSAEELRSDIDVNLQSNPEMKDDRIQSLSRQLRSMRREKNKFVGVMKQTIKDKESELQIITKQNSRLREQLGQAQRNLIQMEHESHTDTFQPDETSSVQFGEDTSCDCGKDNLQSSQTLDGDKTHRSSIDTISDEITKLSLAFADVQRENKGLIDTITNQLDERNGTESINHNYNNIADVPGLSKTCKRLLCEVDRKDAQLGELQKELDSKELELKEMNINRRDLKEIKESATLLFKEFSDIEQIRQAFRQHEKEYDEERTEHQRQIKDLKELVNKKDAAMIDALRNASSEASAELQANLISKDDKIRQLTADKANLEWQIKKTQAGHNDFVAVKNELKALREESSSDLRNLQFDSKNLFDTIKNILSHDESLMVNSGTTMNHLELKAQSLETKLHALSVRGSIEENLQRDLFDKEKELRETRTQMADLDKQFKSLKDAYQTVRDMRTNLEERMKQLQIKMLAEFDEIKASLSQKEKENTILNSSVSALEVQLNSSRTMGSKNESKLLDTTVEKTELQNRLENQIARAADLESTLKTRDNQIRLLEREMNTLKEQSRNEIGNLRLAIVDLENQLKTEKQSNLSTANAAMKDLSKRRQKTKELEAEIEGLRERLESMSQTIEQQQTALKTLEQQREDEVFLHKSNSDQTLKLLRERDKSIMELKNKLGKAEAKLLSDEKKYRKLRKDIEDKNVVDGTIPQRDNSNYQRDLENKLKEKDIETELLNSQLRSLQKQVDDMVAASHAIANDTDERQEKQEELAMKLSATSVVETVMVASLSTVIDNLHRTASAAEEQTIFAKKHACELEKELHNLYGVAMDMNNDVLIAQKQIRAVTDDFMPLPKEEIDRSMPAYTSKLAEKDLRACMSETSLKIVFKAIIGALQKHNTKSRKRARSPTKMDIDKHRFPIIQTALERQMARNIAIDLQNTRRKSLVLSHEKQLIEKRLQQEKSSHEVEMRTAKLAEKALVDALSDEIQTEHNKVAYAEQQIVRLKELAEDEERLLKHWESNESLLEEVWVPENQRGDAYPVQTSIHVPRLSVPSSRNTDTVHAEFSVYSIQTETLPININDISANELNLLMADEDDIVTKGVETNNFQEIAVDVSCR